MIARRDVLGALLGVVGVACGATRESVPPNTPNPESALALDPLVDLVPAAGLSWLLEARPRALVAVPMFATVLRAFIPDDRFDAFANRHGGVDLRLADDLAIAGQEHATLALARMPVEPGRIEAAFAARARLVEGRAVEQGVTRFWGTVGEHREQVALFGRRAVGIEVGALGPLRAAIYFAQQRLKQSRPALRTAPLDLVSARLGEAPLRAFAPGPFEGDWAAGLGGLLAASTAAGASLGASDGGTAGALRLRIVLTGAWGNDARAAAQRLKAAFGVLALDPLGRLVGLDRPTAEPTVTDGEDAIALAVGLDPLALGRGIRAVTDAPLAEIMAF